MLDDERRRRGNANPVDSVDERSAGKQEDDERLPQLGLAVALEILTGILGGCFTWNVSSLYNLSKTQCTSHMMIAIDIKAFLPCEEDLAR